MTKEEYAKIKELLDQGKTEEIYKYLEERINAKYINKARTAIMKIIDDDCEIEYPSYHQRVNLHMGVRRYYKGIITTTESGLIIFHKNSNVFNLNTTGIVNKTIEDIICRNEKYSDDTERNRKISLIESQNRHLDTNYPMLVNFTHIEKGNTELWPYDESVSALVPTYYYDIAHQLLGEDTKEFINKTGSGVCLRSEYGSAVIMSRRRTKE